MNNIIMPNILCWGKQNLSLFFFMWRLSFGPLDPPRQVYAKLLEFRATYSNITRFFFNLNKYWPRPKCNRKCYRGYKQTFLLLKIDSEMVENNSSGKMSNFGIFLGKCHKWRYKTLCRLKLSLHLQFLQWYNV